MDFDTRLNGNVMTEPYKPLTHIDPDRLGVETAIAAEEMKFAPSLDGKISAKRDEIW